MDCQASFNDWLENSKGYTSLKNELLEISKNKEEIQKRFSGDLKFGTAGLRGIMGAGDNRLNVFTVRRATQGLCNYLLAKSSNPRVVISFDSRLNSLDFAQESAKVLSANGVQTYITKGISPTPFLSFAVRHLGCRAGIMITASHNPSQYNGYKCYGQDGAQMDVEHTDKIYNCIKQVNIFNDVKYDEWNGTEETDLIKFVNAKVYDDYIQSILSQSINPQAIIKNPISVTYTPLNGAGNEFVRKVLGRVGIKNIYVVKEQEEPDGNFPTCKYPNPESPEVFDLAIKNATSNNSNLVIATDPDSDRIGVQVLHQGKYKMLTGNELGVLLLDYILSQKSVKGTLAQSPVAIRTMVSSKMADTIAQAYGCTMISVPTGFKYIGAQIKKLENNHKENSFVFGFEESGGFLSGTYTRDKDAVCTAMLVCEAAAFYQSRGLSLIDVLGNLQKKHGFYSQKTINFEFSSQDGPSTINYIMEHFRSYMKNPEPNQYIAEEKIMSIIDYLNLNSYNFMLDSFKKFECPYKSLDILDFELQNNVSIMIRPSGTEPKLKVYINAFGDNEGTVKSKIQDISLYIDPQIQKCCTHRTKL